MLDPKAPLDCGYSLPKISGSEARTVLSLARDARPKFRVWGLWPPIPKESERRLVEQVDIAFEVMNYRALAVISHQEMATDH